MGILKKILRGRTVKAGKYLNPVKGSSVKADNRKKALKPGKRISKKGKVYYEYRRNRADLTPSKGR